MGGELLERIAFPRCDAGEPLRAHGISSVKKVWQKMGRVGVDSFCAYT